MWVCSGTRSAQFGTQMLKNTVCCPGPRRHSGPHLHGRAVLPAAQPVGFPGRAEASRTRAARLHAQGARRNTAFAPCTRNRLPPCVPLMPTRDASGSASGKRFTRCARPCNDIWRLSRRRPLPHSRRGRRLAKDQSVGCAKHERRGGDRPCMCAGYWGRKPNVPHAKGLRAKDSHPPPDVHLRRGAKTSPKTFRGRAYGCPRIRHASPQAPRSTPARSTNGTPEKPG